MKNEMVEVLNTETGERGRIRRRLFESPVFNRNGILVEVEANQKPYLPEMYKSRVEDDVPKPKKAEAKKADADEKEESL